MTVLKFVKIKNKIKKEKQKLKFLDLVHIISKAGYGRIYGREWLVCVDYFCVLLLEIL